VHVYGLDELQLHRSAVPRQKDVSQISVRIIISALSEMGVGLTVFRDMSFCLGTAELSQ